MSNRRQRFVACAALAIAGLAATVACSNARADGPRMIVLGIDGFDHELATELMAAGRLPNFARLAQQGSFQPLATAASPQSPVAWSNFITGLDSGGHGIYDFLHRDLSSGLPFGTPYAATTKQVRGTTWEFGRWLVPSPFDPDSTELMRHGTPFWQLLEDNGIESTLVRMPANFPPVGVGSYELSGMGTPNLAGSPGEFTLYSTDRRQFMKTEINGGHVYPADVSDGVFEGRLYLFDDNPATTDTDDAVGADFSAYVDAENRTVKVVFEGAEVVLQEGEWSDWLAVDFEFIPYVVDLTGSVRLYAKSIAPEFELYVSSIQMDPMNPAQEIASPSSFSAQLAEASGRFYTEEMPEDTWAFINEVFSTDEFLEQTSIVRRETVDQYRALRDSWTGGFLFYYFGSVDQVSHVLWGLTRDPEHPARTAAHDAYVDVIPSIYEEFDALIGETLDGLDDDTMLVVMSDHGFASWTQTFNINTWLQQNGYMELQRRARLPVKELFAGVDWRRTQAYSIGISGLYLNQRGREPQGMVAPGDRMETLERIERDLLATIDPATGQPAVTRVFIKDRDFHDRGHLEIGPDIIVGFAEGLRGSGKQALGGIEENVFNPNVEDWSGDHIMDPAFVPGVLYTSRPLGKPATSLQDLAAAILNEFGIQGFPDGSAPVTVESDG